MPTDPPPAADDANVPSPDFRPDARKAFRGMIKSAGTTLHVMPTSCELYLRQHLGPFEPERLALAEALRRGVPDRIAKHPGGAEFDAFLKGEADALAKAAGLSAGAAWGAVECWALGVGRPGGSAPPRPVARSLEVADPKAGVSDDTLRLAMTGIATTGGFLGGFFGSGFAFLAVFLLGLLAALSQKPDPNAPAPKPAQVKPTDPAAAVAPVLVLIGMSICGVSGAMGAGGGWLMGRGDERPWTGFSAGGGAAFVTGAISSAVIGPGLIAAVFILVAAFGGAYAAASSGGYRT